MRKDSNNLKVQIVKRSDLILNKIECRKADVQAELAAYITAGYTIYDVALAANSGFTGLHTATAGNYVCVWRGARAASYTLVLADITRHTNVVIFNAEVNALNQITAIADNTYILPAGDYTSKLNFYSGITRLYTCTGTKTILFKNTSVYVNQAVVDIENPIFNYCNIYLSQNMTLIMSTYKQSLNSHFWRSSGAVTLEIDINYASNSIWFLNSVFENFCAANSSKLYFKSTTDNRICNLSMCKLVNTDPVLEKVTANDGTIIYYDSSNMVPSSGIPAWNNVPSAGFTPGAASYIDMGVDSSGALVVAFSDGNASNKLSVMKYSGGAWANVGSAGISAAAATHIALYVDGANYYVAYSDGSASGKLTVKKWDGSSWTTYLNAVSSGSATYISILYSPTYYTFTFYYADGSNSDKLAVYSTSGGETKLLTTFPVSYVSSIYFTVYGGYRPVAFGINTSTGNIFSLNANGLSGVVEFSGTGCSYLSICKISDFPRSMPYLIGKLSSNNKACVWRTTDGTSLTLVQTDISAAAADYPKMYYSSDFYIAFEDGNASSKATVMKWNGSVFANVGSAGFSATGATYLSLVVYAGVPYLVYCDANATSKATCMGYTANFVTTNFNYLFSLFKNAVYDGKLSLDITVLENTSSYFNLSGKIKPQNELVETISGRVMRNTYAVDFLEKYELADLAKDTGAEDFWIVEMEDEEDDLVGLIVKNLELFSGVTVYSYNNSDNLIIVANSATKGKAVFCWYNKKLYRTLFSDDYLNESYTIIGVYQLWWPKSMAELVNKFANIEDSSVESGTITFNNYDNEVIV